MREEYVKQAKHAELYHDWKVACHYWELAGDHEQAQACLAISHAIYFGDQFRKLTKTVIQDWENRDINNRQLHDALQEAHDKVYGKV
jgi:hypothetical protein